MDNFQYSVQLSEQEWAEFSATADECGLLQAHLASGDELLSSDIEQGDSSGSSPPGPPPLFTGQLASGGRGQQDCEVEDVATHQLVSRFRCEPVLALGASQQGAGTSAQSDAALLSFGLDAALPGQCSSLPGSAVFGDKMQRLLQGPASSSPGEPPQSPESPGLSATPQRPPDSPGAPLKSPGRKKRRAVGAKGGKGSGAPGPAVLQRDSPLVSAGGPEEGLVAGTAKLMPKAQQDMSEPDSAGTSENSSSTPEHVTRKGPGLDLPVPIPTIERDTDQIRMEPRAELQQVVSKPVQEAHPDVSMAKPHVALSIPTSQPQTDRALSAPASKPQPYEALSAPASKPQPHVTLSAPASKPQPYEALSESAPKSQSDMALSASAPKSQRDMALSASASKPDKSLPTPVFKTHPSMNLPTPASESGRALPEPASESQLDQIGSASASTPRLHASMPAAVTEIKPEVDPLVPDSLVEPCTAPPHVSQAEAAVVDTEVVVSLGEHQEKLGGEPSGGVSGHSSEKPHPGTVQAPKRKKVRFSMAVSGHEESGSGDPASSPSPTLAGPPTTRTAAGSRGGPAAWDAVAIGSRPPQPRILKHLPPPAPSASAGPEPGSCFAVTLPEAYEFFFCDTIEEEDEDADDEAVARQALGDVQWPDTCEFFFRDCKVQRSRCQGGHPCAPVQKAEAVPAAPPGDLVPISIPEAYEHFFAEELGAASPPPTLLQLQTTELSREAGLQASSEPVPARAQQLGLTTREAGELRGPLTSFTFSQNDMCLVFVAFATWAVRTSDLHTPDAWKTVLLANLGTISAIRYFRRQAGRRHSSSSSRSPSPTLDPNC